MSERSQKPRKINGFYRTSQLWDMTRRRPKYALFLTQQPSMMGKWRYILRPQTPERTDRCSNTVPSCSGRFIFRHIGNVFASVYTRKLINLFTGFCGAVSILQENLMFTSSSIYCLAIQHRHFVPSTFFRPTQHLIQLNMLKLQKLWCIRCTLMMF